MTESYHEKAAEHLLEDDLTARKAVGLAEAGYQLGEEHELYDDIEEELTEYLESTDDMLKSSPPEDERVEFSEIRDILRERGNNLRNATETAYGSVSEKDRELISGFQQAYLFMIGGSLRRDGEEVGLLQP
jgi:hypothetical protein